MLFRIFFKMFQFTFLNFFFGVFFSLLTFRRMKRNRSIRMVNIYFYITMFTRTDFIGFISFN